jgi:hypothetical protein
MAEKKAEREAREAREQEEQTAREQTAGQRPEPEYFDPSQNEATSADVSE